VNRDAMAGQATPGPELCGTYLARVGVRGHVLALHMSLHVLARGARLRAEAALPVLEALGVPEGSHVLRIEGFQLVTAQSYCKTNQGKCTLGNNDPGSNGQSKKNVAN
jgi:hypothetical protein